MFMGISFNGRTDALQASNKSSILLVSTLNLTFEVQAAILNT
jgi:hypothetical protein